MTGSLKMIGIGVLGLFLASNAAHAAETEAISAALRESRGIYLLAKPTPFLATGAGLEVGSYLSRDIAFGINTELDSFLVGGFAFAGGFVRRYLGNSFFAQAGVGYSEYFVHDWKQRDVGAHFMIGNEWQYESGLVIGGDWIGLHQQLNDHSLAPSFPKLRVGFAF